MITNLFDDNGTPSNPADDFRPVYVSGDTNGNGKLDIGETWVFTSKGVPGATSVSPAGTLANTVTVQAQCVTTGVPGCVSGTTVADTAMNRVTGTGTPLVQIKKAIDAVDPLHPTVVEEADSPTGPVLAVGAPITWTYRVWTTSPTAVTITVITDDNGTPNNGTDDFTPVYVSGDTNGNGKLDPGEVWLYRATGTAVLGQYTNTVDVQVVTSTGTTATATDKANYLGTEGIRIVKAVNAKDPLNPTRPKTRTQARGRASRSARRSRSRISSTATRRCRSRTSSSATTTRRRGTPPTTSTRSTSAATRTGTARSTSARSGSSRRTARRRSR